MKSEETKDENKDETAAELNLEFKDISKMKNLNLKTFHPIDDAPYVEGQHIPFSLVAKACDQIEKCHGKDSQAEIIEILSNVFRSAILLKPTELIPLFYFFITRLGPEYVPLETGVGSDMLMHAVQSSCGRDLKKIRADLKAKGDLG